MATPTGHPSRLFEPAREHAIRYLRQSLRTLRQARAEPSLRRRLRLLLVAVTYYDLAFCGPMPAGDLTGSMRRVARLIELETSHIERELES